MISTSTPKWNPQPWCVVRQLPNLQSVTIARFHRRRDADGYVWVMKRLAPGAPLQIVFDAETVS